MGAAAGNPALICTVLRISARYGNLSSLEEGYGINLVPLVRFAMEQYENDPCERFGVNFREDAYDVRDIAISIADVATEPFTRVELLADILKNMEDLYELACEQGFAPILEEWRKYSCTLGQEVKVIAPDMTYYGTAIDIDEEGLLIVKKTDGELEKVVAGDVSIRPAAAQNNAYA